MTTIANYNYISNLQSDFYLCKHYKHCSAIKTFQRLAISNYELIMKLKKLSEEVIFVANGLKQEYCYETVI